MGIDRPGMTSQEQADDRIVTLTAVLDLLRTRGIVPSSVEIDGLRIGVAAYDDPDRRRDDEDAEPERIPDPYERFLERNPTIAERSRLAMSRAEELRESRRVYARPGEPTVIDVEGGR